MSPENGHGDKIGSPPIDATVEYDKIALDNQAESLSREVRRQVDQENAVTEQQNFGARPTSSVDAYNLLKDGLQPVALGDFLVSKKLGLGGMGAVFKAKQISLDRDVALKVLARHLADDAKFVSRFQREARVMAQLDHINIIRCYSVGQEIGLWYLAMEYIDGCSLQELIDQHGKLNVGDALYITLRVAGALNYAHELNMVHRDIKPDNILITRKGIVKLADLGLAKPINDDLSMTASGVGAGTPHYMAPEQMRSAKEVDGRSDIYALGCMLYIMLTGKKPHDGQTLVKLLEQKEKGRFEPARTLNPQVPDKLDLMIDRMMAKSLTARYQSCAELIHDLESLGLAHDYLTVLFPDGHPGISTGSSARSSYVGTRRSNKEPSSSSQFVKPVISREHDSEAAVIWYLTVGTTAKGKKKVRRLTQSQMMELIKARKISSTDEASKQAGAGYRALASYIEFESLFRSQIAQQKFEKKSETLQDKFAEIAVEEEDQYEPKKGWGRLFHSVGGWVILIIGIALVAGIVFGLYKAWPMIMNVFAK